MCVYVVVFNFIKRHLMVCVSDKLMILQLS